LNRIDNDERKLLIAFQKKTQLTDIKTQFSVPFLIKLCRQFHLYYRLLIMRRESVYWPY